MEVYTVDDKLNDLSAGCEVCYNAVKRAVVDSKELIQASGRSEDAKRYIKELELKLQELRQTI